MSTIKGLPVTSNNIQELDKNKKTTKSNTSSKAASESVKASSQTTVKDSVDISSVARELMQQPTSVENMKAELDNIKTLDRATLKEIHSKIESNYYDQPEVLDKIVEGIIPEAHSTESVETTEQVEAEDQLQQIQENIENGKYDSEEVLDTIVDRILSSDNILS